MLLLFVDSRRRDRRGNLHNLVELGFRHFLASSTPVGRRPTR